METRVDNMPLPEHPRPDARRENWMNLNGEWQFAFDEENVGFSEGWSSADKKLAWKIAVPFAPESRLSGVHDEGLHKICWYKRSFDLPDALRGRRVFLRFGAVDYETEVWLNGVSLGKNVGGYRSFGFEITDAAKATGNHLAVRVVDDPLEPKCRGKQSPERFPKGCRYTRVTGIWQTVWLEGVGATYARDWRPEPDFDSGDVRVKVFLDGDTKDLTLSARAFFACRQYQVAVATATAAPTTEMTFTVPGRLAWSPDVPNLYYLELEIKDASGASVDRVLTYFAFRKFEARGDRFFLNDQPVFLKGALDQGYYPDGLYTPPTDQSRKEDVLWAKRLGLNFIRKHQIVADPRFYYWCDALGLMVWSEMPDWGGRAFDTPDKNVDARFWDEWRSLVERDINHPSIIAWVPFNEWTAPEDAAITAIKEKVYRFTKELDPSRLALDNSGYCHAVTDICDLHMNPLPRNGSTFRKWWTDFKRDLAEGKAESCEDRPVYAKGHAYRGEPIVFSETGNWGIEEFPPMGPWTFYAAGPALIAEDFVMLYRDYFAAITAEPDVAGFCYVQLYDVEGEVNGYLTYDRRPKVPVDQIREIHAAR